MPHLVTFLEVATLLGFKGCTRHHCSHTGHIQPGNVILERETAKLVDIENCLIGQPSIYRHHLLEIRKIYVSYIYQVFQECHIFFLVSLCRLVWTKLCTVLGTCSMRWELVKCVRRQPLILAPPPSQLESVSIYSFSTSFLSIHDFHC